MPAVQDICHEIAEELCDMARWWSGGGMSAEHYRSIVSQFEARKLARHGFQLSSAISEDGLVQFTLRHATTGELCASMDVDPKTGILEVQHTTP